MATTEIAVRPLARDRCANCAPRTAPTSPSPSRSPPSRWSASSAPRSTTATPTRSRPRCRPPPNSTALMLSKDAATLTTGADPDQGQRLLQGAVHPPRSDRPERVRDLHHQRTARRSIVNATSNVKTDFMGLMGISTLKVAVNSQVGWGNTKLRVALALDTTGSMATDGKMAALKTATKSLLDDAQDRRHQQRRRLRLDHPVQQGRQRRQEQLQRELDRLGRLGRRQRRRRQHDDLHQEDRQERQVQEEVHDLDAPGCRTTTTPGTAASPTATQDYDVKNTTPTPDQQHRHAVPGRAVRRLPGQDHAADL